MRPAYKNPFLRARHCGRVAPPYVGKEGMRSGGWEGGELMMGRTIIGGDDACCEPRQIAEMQEHGRIA